MKLQPQIVLLEEPLVEVPPLSLFASQNCG